MASNKKTTPIALKPLDELFGMTGNEQDGVCEVDLCNLHPFQNHPFKVLDDEKMEELVDSVKEHGVLVPGIVRLRNAGGYELISGHRRKRACELAGLEKMPVIIQELSDDEATVVMVDSNIQREELLPSEKAFAYKMRLDAMKHQGERTDLTLCQVGTKSRADNNLSKEVGESARNIQRYIRLTELLPCFLEMTDEKKIPFGVAVELSYLKTEEQEQLFLYMNQHQVVPSLKQAQEMKQQSKDSVLSYAEIDLIFYYKKPVEKRQIKMSNRVLNRFFSSEYTKEQIEDVILKLLEEWSEREK